MNKAVWKWLLAVPLLAALVVPVVGWQIEARRLHRDWNQRSARERDKPIPVRTALVTQGDAVDVIGATCVTQPFAAAAIIVDTANPEISIRELTKAYVSEGDAVKKGQPLFEFDPHLFEQTLEQARADVKMQQDQVKSIEQLVGEGAASSVELSTAKARLEAARLAVQIAVLDLEQSVVRSPLDGVMGAVAASPGVRIPDMSELVSIYQLDPILVRMDFPLERLDSVHIGKDAEVTLDSFPNQTLHGKVVRLSPNAVPQTRVLHVYIELPNKDLRLRGGITGFSRLTSPKQAVTVPRSAVIRRKGRAMVFRVESDVARLTEIQTGPMVNDGQLELVNGLRPGDEVVIFGQDELQDGDRVDVDWRRWSNREEQADAGEVRSVDSKLSGSDVPAADIATEASPSDLIDSDGSESDEPHRTLPITKQEDAPAQPGA